MPPGHGLHVGTDVHDLEVGSSLPPGDAQDHSDHQTWQQLLLPTELINFGFFFFFEKQPQCILCHKIPERVRIKCLQQKVPVRPCLCFT